ncbi:hypothetical protein CI105_02600 [Candidatus Izimaplasma bacterium ZiA1]|uniref:GNAT family N-acetyltransferase n=1 Tax=Candidatus Izimoplasma sp. ZiA1 TaxID=2024899 RepID=UPI000BAA53A0|nr:hypothetical protein CI105_02600 [Candidatus Izimaplasma bacterium ZiA1]
MSNLIIKETKTEDLINILKLWNDGDTMKYVGFPNGLGITLENLEKWLKNININEKRKHYSIYENSIGYCGETYYEIDNEHDLATLDIKLLKKARGKGIASKALSNTISTVFDNNLASRAYVDPNPLNKDAFKLYEKLGFYKKQRPKHLEPYETYLEINKNTFKKR